MRAILIALALVASGAAWASPGRCLLVVEGKTYLNGPCPVEVGRGGSVTVGGGPRAPFFAVVNPAGNGLGKGYWNEERGATHAHTDLGDLRRNDACWSNERAIVCAWR